MFVATPAQALKAHRAIKASGPARDRSVLERFGARVERRRTGEQHPVQR
jgi:hypothetical protein